MLGSDFYVSSRNHLPAETEANTTIAIYVRDTVN